MAERQITGDDIIAEVLRNCEAGQFSLRRTILLPSIFHVYLHPSDYELVRPVIPALTSETRAALIDRAGELNRRAKGSSVAKMLGFESGKSVEYRIADSEWTVEFHPDAEDKLQPGDIEVYSELASSAKPDFDGAMTRQVTRRSADGGMSATRVDAAEDAPTVRIAPPTGGRVYGWLRYEDSGNPQVFEITKAQTAIGRGGKTFWVDVKLNAPPDVSREHCRIRRDAASGLFFIKDLSQFGTSVNATPVPSSVAGGSDADIEVELPPRAAIDLAGVVVLEFEAADR